MVNEVALSHEWIINETVFHAVWFGIPSAGVTGHCAGSLRPFHQQDAAKLVLYHQAGSP